MSDKRMHDTRSLNDVLAEQFGNDNEVAKRCIEAVRLWLFDLEHELRIKNLCDEENGKVLLSGVALMQEKIREELDGTDQEEYQSKDSSEVVM